MMHSWHDAEGLRHAISHADYPLPPRPDEQIVSLCGKELTLTRADFPQLAEYRPYKKTCFGCDAEWRIREGIKPNPVVR
jgi:hypothetical protein